MGCLTRLLQRWAWARAFIFLSGYHYSFEDKIKLGLAVTLSPILPPVCPFSHVNLNGSRSNHVWRMPPHHIFLLRIARIRAGFLYRKFAIPPLFRFLRYCSVVLSIWLLPIIAIAQVPISGRQYIHLVGRLNMIDLYQSDAPAGCVPVYSATVAFCDMGSASLSELGTRVN